MKLKWITYPEIPHYIPKLYFIEIPPVTLRVVWVPDLDGRVKTENKEVKIEPDPESHVDGDLGDECIKTEFSSRKIRRRLKQPYIP